MTVKQFISECHKREVFKLLSIYIVSSWVVLQVLSVIYEPLGFPEKSITYLIIILLVGFPLYLMYLWKYRVRLNTDDGDDSDELSEGNQRAFSKMYFVFSSIVTAVAAISVFLIFSSTNLDDQISLPKINSEDKIAVLRFSNDTGDEKLDVVSKMSADWITHGIAESNAGQVITQDIINDYSNVLMAQSNPLSSRDILENYLRPTKTIVGSFFRDSNELIFRCSIVNGSNNETLISFPPTKCSEDSPLDCIEEVRQKILGFLISEKLPGERLQKFPPKYQAYQYFLESQTIGDEDPLYLELLNKAIETDSTYFEAMAFKVLYYYNNDQFKIADSLRRVLLPQTGLSDRERNLLNHYDALFTGNNYNAWKYLEQEYNISPFNITTNRTMMVLSLQYINDVERVDDYYDVIPMDGYDLNSCQDCVFRYYVKGLADIQKKEYYKVIDLFEKITPESNSFLLKKPLISAYVRTLGFESLDLLLDKISLQHQHEDWEEGNLYAGQEILMQADSTVLANKYFDHVIKRSNNTDSENYTSAHFYKGDYQRAEQLLISLFDRDSTNVDILSKLIISKDKNGKSEEADELMDRLNTLRGDFQYGSIDYAMAQIHAERNKPEKALEHLKQSIAAGNVYAPEKFQNDYHFKSIVNTPEFEQIMSFWRN